MDQNLLLTVEKLTLNPDIQRGSVTQRTFVIKNIAAQTYLAVSREQAVVLEAFIQGETVPKVLARLMQERICVPLREFYELVVKAYRAGILCSAHTRKPVVTPVRWPGFHAKFLIWPAVITASAAVVQLGCGTIPLTRTWEACVLGLVVALAALSLGQMLAASLLVGASGEIYSRKPFASWVRLHLRFDLRDARLLPRPEQALILVAGNLPLSATLLVLKVFFPLAVLPVAALWLLVWRPWGAGLARRLAELLSRYPLKDTDTDFQFLPNQRPQLHWRAWWRRWDWRVCGLELAWAAVWAVLFARLIIGAFGLSLTDMADDWEYWSWSLPLVGSALLLSVAVMMLRRWRDGLRQSVRRLRLRVTTTWRHWRREPVFPDNEAALLRITAAHPLLSQLNLYDQTTVVRAWRPVVKKAWTKLSDGEQESSHVGLILSGRATSKRSSLSGRRVTALALEEGDFFGIPYLKSGDALLEVRSRTPVGAMLLPLEVFKKVVMDRLEPRVVYDLTHKFAFLRRLSICAGWHTHAVARFARISEITTYADGDFVLHEGDDARWFYIVYDGIAQVRSRGRLCSRLSAGDFFGEISLLQNSVTVADVVAQGQLRCLQIDRTSFLRFMTHNHHVALQLERISSKRLGHPIFPLCPAM